MNCVTVWSVVVLLDVHALDDRLTVSSCVPPALVRLLQVQRMFRGFGGKQQLKRLRAAAIAHQIAMREAAATRIQRRVLTWIARKWFKWIAHRRWNAVLYIQSW